MITLGIETSCDETAISIIETSDEQSGPRYRVLASLIHSQAELHSAYGGVYPTLAKREHSKNIIPLLEKALVTAGPDLPTMRTLPQARREETLDTLRHEWKGQNTDLLSAAAAASFLDQVPAIDRIAVTEGPGLEPALWVGISFAKILSTLWDIPVVPVDHMEGHILGSLLAEDALDGAWRVLNPLLTPAVALLISGGHTELVHIDGSLPTFSYNIIGKTKDDAVGEAFDKTARLLGIPYPGGPRLSTLAQEARTEGIASPLALPRPMISSKDLDFSFSGLKTAVLYAVRAHATADGSVSDAFKKGLASEFEEAVTETLGSKLRQAIEKTGAKAIIVGGGVAANMSLRNEFAAISQEYSIPLHLPSSHISGDNALMIALSGALHAPIDSISLKADGTKSLGTKTAAR